MRLAQLEDETIDMMLWILCGIAPHTKPSNFGCDNKLQMRIQSREQSEGRRAAQPGRLNLLSEDWDNVPAVAMKLGSRDEWLCPETFAAWDRARRRVREGFHDELVEVLLDLIARLGGERADEVGEEVVLGGADEGQ